MKEVVHQLPVAGLQLLQADKGYRHNLDPFLLRGFCRIRRGEKVVDLGTGSGILPLLLAATTEAATLVGVEIQPALAALACKNVALNGYEGRIAVVPADLRELDAFPALAAGGVDVVVSNPPYRQVGRGRLAPDGERAATRHELHGGIVDFLQAAARLLRSGGRIYLIFLAERMPELLAEMRCQRLEPKRLRLVHSEADGEARLLLVEGRKAGRPGAKVEAPLVLYEKGVYTREVQKLLGEDRGKAER